MAKPFFISLPKISPLIAAGAVCSAAGFLGSAGAQIVKAPDFLVSETAQAPAALPKASKPAQLPFEPVPVWKSYVLGTTTYRQTLDSVKNSHNYYCRLTSELKFPNNERQITILGPCLGADNLKSLVLNFSKEQLLNGLEANYGIPYNADKSAEFVRRLLAEFGRNFTFSRSGEGFDRKLSYRMEDPAAGLVYYVSQGPGTVILTIRNRKAGEGRHQITESTKAVTSNLHNWEEKIAKPYMFSLAFTPEELLRIQSKDAAQWKKLVADGCSVKGILTGKNLLSLELDNVEINLRNLKRAGNLIIGRPVLLHLKDLSARGGTLSGTLVTQPIGADPSLKDKIEALDLLARGKRNEAEAQDPDVLEHYAQAKVLEGFLGGGPCFVPFQDGKPFNEKQCLNEIQNYFKRPGFTRQPMVDFFRSEAEHF